MTAIDLASVPATPTVPTAADAVRDQLPGTVLLPADGGYEAARLPWNVAVAAAARRRRRPARHRGGRGRRARRRRGRAAGRAPGHRAQRRSARRPLRHRPAADVGDDRRAGRPRDRPGDGTGRHLWLDAVEAAAAHGRTVLHGSSPDVGVVGYSLGGGMGWYARLLGLQTNSVTGAEVVLADGSVVRTDAEHEPDLFWALRGGGGNFGVVTRARVRQLRLHHRLRRHAAVGLVARRAGPSRWAAWAARRRTTSRRRSA